MILELNIIDVDDINENENIGPEIKCRSVDEIFIGNK